MKSPRRRPLLRSAGVLVLGLAAVGAAAACRGETPQDPPPTAPAPTNRIDVPEAVRRNLGITFVAVERRRVAATLRLPGQFESLPQARAVHTAPLAGRVDVKVTPLQPVQHGTVLATIDAPEWRTMQRQLGELATDAAVTRAHRAAMEPLLEAHKAHETSLQEALTVLRARLAQLEATQRDLGGQAQALTEARVQLAQVQAQIAEAAEQHTETSTRLARLAADAQAQVEREATLLASAAATLGTPVATLTETTSGGPRWRTLDRLELRAMAAGVVETLPVSSGSFVAAHEPVVTVLDPTLVRFRARALQSDLGRLRDGMPSTLTPAGAVDPAARLTGPLQLGVGADPALRTVDVFVVPSTSAPFARAGVAGHVEVELLAAAGPVLAIPRRCLLPDGLRRVFFRRDTADRDRVVRVEAEVGVDDGRWVEIKTGLADGDEVVLTGAYELVLASSASAPSGGHFHSDGTFHAGEHK